MDVLKLMTRRMLCRIGIHAWTKTRATIKKSEYVLLYIDDYKCKFCGKFRYQKQTDELRQMAKSFERRTKCTLPRNY